MTTEWRDTFSNAPGWLDVGKMVEVRCADGRAARGRLEADAYFNGEDEIPIVSIAGVATSWFDFEEWRVVDG
jgi:hypothetical protein